MTLQDKVIRVLAATFAVPADQITADATPKTIRQWDSLRHMNMVLALEDEFGVQFTDSQIGELTSLPAIVDTLRVHGAS